MAAIYCSHTFAWLYGFTVGKHFSSRQVYDSLYFNAQKSLHLTLFLILGAALWQVLLAGRRLIFAVLAGCSVGTSSEILQVVFPYHHPAIRDVLIDTVDAFLGTWACSWRSPRESTREYLLPIEHRR